MLNFICFFICDFKTCCFVCVQLLLVCSSVCLTISFVNFLLPNSLNSFLWAHYTFRIQKENLEKWTFRNFSTSDQFFCQLIIFVLQEYFWILRRFFFYVRLKKVKKIACLTPLNKNISFTFLEGKTVGMIGERWWLVNCLNCKSILKMISFFYFLFSITVF